MNSPTRKRAALAGALAAAFGLGVAFAPAWSRFASRAAAGEGQSSPAPSIRNGDKIIVPPGSPLRTELVVRRVAVTDNTRPLVFPATVEADPAKTINILPPVAGRIVELRVRLGDHVVKGQALAVLESGDLAQAYADDDKAQNEVKRTKRILERARALNKTGAGAIKDLEQAETDYEEASAELARAEARLKEIGVKSGKADSRLLTLAAPVTGSVVGLMCAPGTYANDTTASLMTIANLDAVWVTASVPESDVAHIAKGEAVDVTLLAYPGQTLRGAVAFVSDLIEADTRRCKVRVVFANADGKLKPNMFASASFRVPQESAIFVPNSALLMNNDSTVVLVEVEPWTFVRRPVVPGYGEAEGTRITQGLVPSDRIVVKGGVLLND